LLPNYWAPKFPLWLPFPFEFFWNLVFSGGAPQVIGWSLLTEQNPPCWPPLSLPCGGWRVQVVPKPTPQGVFGVQRFFNQKTKPTIPPETPLLENPVGGFFSEFAKGEGVGAAGGRAENKQRGVILGGGCRGRDRATFFGNFVGFWWG